MTSTINYLVIFKLEHCLRPFFKSRCHDRFTHTLESTHGFLELPKKGLKRCYNICPKDSCPNPVCPSIVCPKTVCHTVLFVPSTVCPKTVCPKVPVVPKLFVPLYCLSQNCLSQGTVCPTVLFVPILSQFLITLTLYDNWDNCLWDKCCSILSPLYRSRGP